jgi:hypothetical protein
MFKRKRKKKKKMCWKYSEEHYYIDNCLMERPLLGQLVPYVLCVCVCGRVDGQMDGFEINFLGGNKEEKLVLSMNGQQQKHNLVFKKHEEKG